MRIKDNFSSVISKVLKVNKQDLNINQNNIDPFVEGFTKETEEQREKAKSYRFGVYVKTSQLFHYRSKQKDKLSKTIAATLKSRMEHLERIYPDFPSLYLEHMQKILRRT